MMKRIVAVLFLLLLLAAGLALVAPGFIDWNRHKDILIARIEPYVQREIKVAGDVSFRILPNPQILLNDVTVESVPGAAVPSLLTLRRLEARVRLKPLLEGRVEVESINLTEPELTLEVLRDGTANWTGVLRGEEGTPRLGRPAEAVRLENVTVSGGGLRYLHQPSGADVRVENLNLSIAGATLRGPYKVAGGMLYRGVPVNIEAETAAPAPGQPVPLHILLQPVDVLPQVAFDGSLSLQDGLALEGTLALTQGTVASLFDDAFVQGLAFLRETAEVRAALSLRPGAVSLDGIDARFGGKGRLGGRIDFALSRDSKPRMTATLEGSDLSLSARKAGFLPAPASFGAGLDLSGKNIEWQGMRLERAKLSAETRNAEWMVSAAEFSLPGAARVSLSGTVTPAQNMAGWEIKATAQDASAMLRALPLPDTHPLAALAHKDVRESLALAGNLDMRPEKTSLYNFNATLGEAGKVSGVLNFFPGKLQARLNMAGMDTGGFPAAAREKIVQNLLRGQVDLEIAAQDMRHGDLALPEWTLTASGGPEGLALHAFTGTLENDGAFSLSGQIGGGLPRAKGFDLDYRLKTGAPEKVAAALGAALPPPLGKSRAMDIAGDWRLAEGSYSLTAEGGFHGGEISLASRAAPRESAEAPLAWQSRMSLSLPAGEGALALFDAPLERLLLPPGAAVMLTADISGVAQEFSLSALRLQAGESAVTGHIDRRTDGVTAALQAPALHFDRWLSGTWQMPVDMTLNLSADKALWRGQELARVKMDMQAGPEALRIDRLEGRLWDGNFTAAGKAARADGKWQGEFSGKLDNAQLGLLASLLGLRGLSVGQGDAVFDLSGSESAEKNIFWGVEGTLGVSLDRLTLDGFDPAGLAEFIEAQKSLPKDIALQLHKALRGGTSDYADVSGEFRLAEGKARIESLSLENAAASLGLSGALDMAAQAYDVKAEMTLKPLPDLGTLTVTRSGGLEKAPDYQLETGPAVAWIERHLPPPPAPEPVTTDPPIMPGAMAPQVEAVPLDAPRQEGAVPEIEVERLPPPETEVGPDAANDPIGGILERLEGSAPAGADDAGDTPPPAESEILPLEE